MRLAALTCLSALVLAGCPDDSDGEGPVGRGTAACQDWQDAICDFGAGRCGALDRARCDEQYQGVTCRSDSAASDCSNAFNTAPCTGAPAGCDLSDIADPAPAQQACEALVARVCERQMECDAATTIESCTTMLLMALPCDTAIAYTLAYESCLTAIDTASCTAASLPDVCAGSIKALQ